MICVAGQDMLNFMKQWGFHINVSCFTLFLAPGSPHIPVDTTKIPPSSYYSNKPQVSVYIVRVRLWPDILALIMIIGSGSASRSKSSRIQLFNSQGTLTLLASWSQSWSRNVRVVMKPWRFFLGKELSGFFLNNPETFLHWNHIDLCYFFFVVPVVEYWDSWVLRGLIWFMGEIFNYLILSSRSKVQGCSLSI